MPCLSSPNPQPQNAGLPGNTMAWHSHLKYWLLDDHSLSTSSLPLSQSLCGGLAETLTLSSKRWEHFALNSALLIDLYTSVYFQSFQTLLGTMLIATRPLWFSVFISFVFLVFIHKGLRRKGGLIHFLSISAWTESQEKICKFSGF